VTWIGRLLRRSHVDELPQLWNVLRGDMVLIGPRPERPEFVTQLEQALPGYRDRMLLYPGVTGLAQVQLPPDADLAGVRRKLAYDLYYIRQVNPWMDFRILVSTALHMVGIPYRWLTVLFMLPGREVVEHTVSARPVPAPLALPQMQAV
jgi:lipopolysaccharide/colanic/teichoic acid biosynthesis glycosyltransferase